MMQSPILKAFKTKEGRRRRFIKKLKEDYNIDEKELKYFRYCGASENNTCWNCKPKRECEQCGKMFIKKANYYICWNCKFGH